MWTLKPLIKTLYIILVVMMLLHTVLSFCDCVIVESGSHLNIDIPSESNQSTEDLFGEFVLLATLLRIALILPRKKVFHVLGLLLSLQISFVELSYAILNQNSMGGNPAGCAGLFWTTYEISTLGWWAIYLSCVIAVFHAVIVGLHCRPEEGWSRNRVKGIMLCVSIVVGFLLLIIFRVIITDWIRDMFRGFYR